MRTRITLACTECKNRNYDTTKDKKTHPDRIEIRNTASSARSIPFIRKQSNGRSGGIMEDKKTAARQDCILLEGVKAEFSKIIWPTKEKLTRQSVAVVVITVITAALIAVLDRGLQYGINFVIK